MTTPASEGLTDVLSQALLGHSYDRKSTAPENFLIDHLVESVLDFEIGEMSFDDLRAQFYREDLGPFDFDSWFNEQVTQGTYVPPENS